MKAHCRPAIESQKRETKQVALEGRRTSLNKWMPGGGWSLGPALKYDSFIFAQIMQIYTVCVRIFAICVANLTAVNGFVLLNRVTPAKVFLARNGLGRVPRALMFEPKDSRIESRAELISQWTMCHRQRRPSLSTQHLPAKNPWATAAAARK